MAPPAARQWRGELLECTGENTDADCKQSCEVTFCPCFGFADNYRRAFRSWYLPHWIVFVICTSLWFWVSVGGYAKCSPLKVPLPRPPPGLTPGRAFNATELAAANLTLANATLVPAMSAYNDLIAVAVTQTGAWSACNRDYNAAIGGTLTIFFLLLVYGGVRRVQLRKKFGLPGDTLNDVCSWLWCSWAALCQETRTLRQAGVKDGVWGAEAAGGGDKASLLAPGSVEMQAGPSAV